MNAHSPTGVFAGLVVSVTGLDQESRQSLREVVESGGGVYSPQLRGDATTHLLATAPAGEKYRCAKDWGIPVLHPDWLHGSSAAGVLLPAQGFAIVEGETTPAARSAVFDGCCFCLAGFPDAAAERAALLVVRRGMGTRCLSLREHVSHVVVGAPDQLEAKWRKQLTTRPVHVRVVQARWLWSCCARQDLVPTGPFEFRSFPAPAPPPLPNGEAVLDRALDQAPTVEASPAAFAGLKIAIVGRAASSELALKDLIKRHGGTVVDDVLAGGVVVVENGDDYVKHGARAAAAHCACATPLWVRCCAEEQRALPTALLPALFRPQPWAIRRFDATGGSASDFVVSVSLFTEAERTAIVQLVKAMGAVYTRKLRRSNTHLICRHAQGDKYDKALEWGVLVVTAEWLLHCAQHGWRQGSESEFKLTAVAGGAPPLPADSALSARASPDPNPGTSAPGPRKSLGGFMAALKKRPLLARAAARNARHKVARQNRVVVDPVAELRHDDPDPEHHEPEASACESQVMWS